MNRQRMPDERSGGQAHKTTSRPYTLPHSCSPSTSGQGRGSNNKQPMLDERSVEDTHHKDDEKGGGYHRIHGIRITYFVLVLPEVRPTYMPPPLPAAKLFRVSTSDTSTTPFVMIESSSPYHANKPAP